MHRALPISRHVIRYSRSGAASVARRQLVINAAEATTVLPPKKKKRIVRKILFYTTAAIGTFYVGSAFVAFNSSTYYDFFSESVPLGNSFLEFAESHDWDTLTTKDVLDAPKRTSSYIQSLISGTTSKAKGETTKTTECTTDGLKDSKQRVHSVAKSLKTKVEKGGEDTLKGTAKTLAIARHRANEFSGEIDDLVQKAEAVLAGKVVEQVNETPSPETSSQQDTNSKPSQTKTVYEGPLPVEFEPPPGFVRPKFPEPDLRPVKEAAPPPLPLVAPAISELGESEPIIAQLASTIDSLASYVKDNPSAASKAKGVLESAKVDLSELATRMDKVKDEERAQLEQKLDEQTREYTLKLLELEMEAQDKLDSQEEGFRKFFDEEKVKFVQGYREKLDNELRTQTELINERLKEEVIAQGIEMQRRWIRDIKIHVEQERGGRLAKLDELAANLKRLERIALDNSSYLDENIRIHSLWSALRALSSTVDSPVRKPFRDELRVLRHIAAAREDAIVVTALESLEASDIPDIGVEPFADLASWLSTSVAPQLSAVALVPDHNAGVLSHLASHVLSAFRFQRHGLVQGSDVLSVLARAEYYMNEKDLDSAARELNQLKGTAKILLSDWLDAARRRLEVLQTLQVIQTQATLASLLVV